MTQNTENRPWLAGGSQEDLAAGGGSAATVAQTPPQNDALFPVALAPLSARPLVLITRGRVEYLAHCPKCSDWHRHVHLGKVTGPCGTEYDLKPRAKGAA